VFATEFVDAWDEVDGGRSPGFTFDPASNIVAQHVVQAVGGRMEPRRLDRICFSASTWHPQKISLAATGSFECSAAAGGQWLISDHYGVLCSFARCEVSEDPFQNSRLCQASEVLPPKVLETLALPSCQASVEVRLLGSAALGTADNASDVDVLCSSTDIGRSEYFTHVSAALVADGFGPVDIVSDAAMPLARFRAAGVKVEVQFATLPVALVRSYCLNR